MHDLFNHCCTVSFLESERALRESILRKGAGVRQGDGGVNQPHSARLRADHQRHAAALAHFSPLRDHLWSCDGKRTCIKQGCAPGVSVWTGSMGAENSLTQKDSYETREGELRGEALLDTWRMMDMPANVMKGVRRRGDVRWMSNRRIRFEGKPFEMYRPLHCFVRGTSVALFLF